MKKILIILLSVAFMLFVPACSDNNVTVSLPTVPIDINFKSQATIKITDISLAVREKALTVAFSGEKTWDKDGNTGLNTVGFAVILYDTSGKTVKTDYLTFKKLSVGEKIRSEYILLKDISEEYSKLRLEIKVCP